ncbi:hypothetical protein HMPREF0307_01186 [Corynebacterium sp. DNF00584]|nr:hypothetical protein HMPREF0307_01186 [Corynebacterium sp. DNF00584]
MKPSSRDGYTQLSPNCRSEATKQTKRNLIGSHQKPMIVDVSN